MIVVEDNPDQWALIKAATQQTMPDIEVVWCSSPGDALDYLNNGLATKKPLPKLMLLDLYVPEADPSWQLLQLLRQPDSPFIWMPVVLISNSVEEQNVNNFYDFGGTSYIIKPTTYEQWVEYLQTVRRYWWDTVTLPGSR